MDRSIVSTAGRHGPGSRRTVLLAAVVLLALLAVGLGRAAQARAYDLAPGTFKAGTLTQDDNDEAYYQQAAGRPPFGVVDFSFATDGNGEPVGQTRSARVDIPAGLTPNPRSAPTCTDAQLDTVAAGVTDCPAASQVGVIRLRIKGTIPLLTLASFGTVPARQTIDVQVPVYNMTRSGDQVGRFAFNPAQAPGANQLSGDLSPIEIIGGVRSDDQGLFFTIPRIPQDPALVRSRLIFWGVPGAQSNDAQRGLSTTDVPTADGTVVEGALGLLTQPTGGNQTATDRTTAFLSMPTSCAGQQTSRLSTTSYADETRTDSYTTPVGVEDCGGVPFSPDVALGPEQLTRDTPSGLDLALNVPQSQDSGTRATSHVKDVTFTLPQGTTISPGVANGLETCSDAQFAKGTSDPIACPGSSRVGSVRIVTPLLDDPLTGDVYLGDPQPGNRYRLLIDANGPGFSVRLNGSVRPDATTGQLTTVVENAPQLPFSDLDLHFDDGPRAVLATPQTCGTATSNSSLTPWSGNGAATQSVSQQVTGCDGNPFDPAVTAAASTTQAGKFTPLGVAFGRRDGDQFLSGLSATLPTGMTAKIKGVTQCSEAQIATIACPDSAQIGTTSVSAGPGSAPYGLTGRLYLTGAYKGGSFGTVAVIHAVAGPYDLGYVTVRQALRIDPTTSRVTIDSDPLPQIQEGILLRLRSLRLDISRTNFVRNPTSCGPAPLETRLTGSAGGVAQPSAGQATTGCDKLVFAPRVAVKFDNKSQMKKGGNPRLAVTVRQSESEAGIRSSRVTLPKEVALASANAGALCTVAQVNADTCPKASIVGSAVATTTILNRPISGPVYFVKGERRTATGQTVSTLPTLYIPLKGEARINVRATTSVSGGRLVTTLPALPDAPLTKFALMINGGKRGIIAATKDLCGKRVKATAKFGGYNGKKLTRTPLIGTSCKVTKKKKKS